MARGGGRAFKAKPITKVRKKIVQPTVAKKKVPTTARAKKIATAAQRSKQLAKEYGVVAPKPKPKVKKSLIARAKALLKPKPKKKKKRKTTWPSGITSQKQFDELMQIDRKKKRKK